MSTLREALSELPGPVFADVMEADDAYLLIVDLPGAASETTDVRVTDGRVRIEARRQKDVPGEFRYLEEERSLFLDATLPLLPDATGDGAEASMDRGVLTLRLPKRGGRGRTIEIE